MAVLTKNLPWIQFILMIAGLILLYGQQIQSVKDIERRTTQCEDNVSAQNKSSADLIKSISDLRVDIRELKTEMKYMRRKNDK